MFDFSLGFLGKLAGALVKPSWNYCSKIIRRPKISLSKAPKNLLDHLKPLASKERVQELLGAPHQVAGDAWHYHFSDVLIQVEYWPGAGAKSVALGLIGDSKAHQFPVPICSKPLGQLSLADVCSAQGMWRYRNSLRHEEILVEIPFGPVGALSYWTFGAMMAVGASALYESCFEWDSSFQVLKSSASGVLINWIAISNCSDEVYFDWSIS